MKAAGSRHRFRSLGVIAARGGSKGIPRKNIKPLAGTPLIAYAIKSARQSRRLTKCVVSTDDAEIAKVAREHRGDVPFRRPAELATDQARQIDALIHATLWMEESEGIRYDAVVVIQPTAPLRTGNDIDQALETLETTQADSVISLSPTPTHPMYTYKLEEDRPVPFLDCANSGGNRQSFAAAYVRNGLVYGVKRDVLVEQRSLYGNDCRGFVVPAERSLNIDSPHDWRLAEYLLQGRDTNEQADPQDSEYRAA